MKNCYKKTAFVVLTLLFIVYVKAQSNQFWVTDFAKENHITIETKNLGIIHGKQTFVSFSKPTSATYKGKKYKAAKPLLIQVTDGDLANPEITDLSEAGLLFPPNYVSGKNSDWKLDFEHFGGDTLIFYKQERYEKVDGEKGQYFSFGFIRFDGTVITEVYDKYFKENSSSAKLLVSSNHQYIAFFKELRKNSNGEIVLEVTLLNREFKEIGKDKFNVGSTKDDLYQFEDVEITNTGKVMVQKQINIGIKDVRKNRFSEVINQSGSTLPATLVRRRVFRWDVVSKKTSEVKIHSFTDENNIILNADFFCENGKQGWIGLTGSYIDGQYKFDGFYLAWMNAEETGIDTIMYFRDRNTQKVLRKWVEYFGVNGDDDLTEISLKKSYFYKEGNKYYFILERKTLESICVSTEKGQSCTYMDQVRDGAILVYETNTKNFIGAAYEYLERSGLMGFDFHPVLGIQFATNDQGDPFFFYFENTSKRGKNAIQLKMGDNGVLKVNKLFDFGEVGTSYTYVGTSAIVDGSKLKLIAIKPKKQKLIEVKLEF